MIGKLTLQATWNNFNNVDKLNEILQASGHFSSLPQRRKQPIACGNVMIIQGAKGTWYEDLEGTHFLCQIVFTRWRRPDGELHSYIDYLQVIYLTKTTIQSCGYLSPKDVMLL